MSTSNARQSPDQGQSDPLDRGTGTATSGGGLTNDDFIPTHPTSPYDETPKPDPDDEKPIVLDDELQKPPDQRSPI
jgi:hypothetical protein